MREDWRISSLEEVVKFIDYRGKTPLKTEYGMRLITAKNLKMGYLQNEPMEFVDPKIYDEWMTRGIQKKETFYLLAKQINGTIVSPLSALVQSAPMPHLRQRTLKCHLRSMVM
jgi:hypothetical protein